MCRLLVCLNKPKSKPIIKAIKDHMAELEKAQGGHGNGLWLPKKKVGNKFVKSFDIKEIWSKTQFPFFFHTRIATFGEISKENCHPWEYKDAILMQNGFAFEFETDRTKSDSWNLLIAWQDSGKDLSDLAWYGNVITFEKTKNVIRFYIQNSLDKITLSDGTILVTSQETAALKPYIFKKETLSDGVFEGNFFNSTITKIKDIYGYSYQRAYNYDDEFDIEERENGFPDVDNDYDRQKTIACIDCELEIHCHECPSYYESDWSEDRLNAQDDHMAQLNQKYF